jgi:hypothetical protein
MLRMSFTLKRSFYLCKDTGAASLTELEESQALHHRPKCSLSLGKDFTQSFNLFSKHLALSYILDKAKVKK